MKRNYLIFLSLLLSQATPVWGMWSSEDENAMATAAPGQQRRNVQDIRFVLYVPPSLHTLTPFDPLPPALGAVRQHVSCTFANDITTELTLPTHYPLRGHWVSDERRENTHNLATLKLRALINGQWRVVGDHHTFTIQHDLLNSEEEVDAGYYLFDGNTFYRTRTKLQRWRNPAGQEYLRNLVVHQVNALPHHEGKAVIYVEPFALETTPNGTRKAKPNDRPKDAYRGVYRFGCDLADHEGLPNKKMGRLIYSDGSHIYLPHVTQELWEKDESNQAGFFIASYKSGQPLHFIADAHIQNGSLPEGLYHLLSVQEGSNGRTEQWQRLGEDPSIVNILSSSGLASIPGMGISAPHIVSNEQAIQDALYLQQRIQDIVAKTEETAALYPNAVGSVIVLGKTGSGKTTFIHSLDGDFNIEENLDGDLCLYPKHPLPGLTVRHAITAGTLIPSVWYDGLNNVVYWDCPGFGDPRGDRTDIINACAIDRLFQNLPTKVVLVVADNDLKTGEGRAAGIFDLLNKITTLFPNKTQLERTLSLIVTKVESRQPQIRLRTLALAVQQTADQNFNLNTHNARQTQDLSPDNQVRLGTRGSLLLNFLYTNNTRIASIPRPQEEVSYQFGRQSLLACIGRAQYIQNLTVDFKAGIGDGAKKFGYNLWSKFK